MCIPRYVIKRTSYPRFLTETASYDVASNTCQASKGSYVIYTQFLPSFVEV